MLQFYSASTSIVNSKRAITECLEIALEGEPNLDCDLIIIYTAMGHNFKDLLLEAKNLAPSAQIVGCTSAGVIGREGPNESMKALAIMAIKGPQNEFAVAGMESLVKADRYKTGVQIAEDLKNKNPDINMIHFMPSAMDIFPVDKIIEGIESVFGSNVPIFGGASTDGKMLSNFQFLGDQIFERGAVAIGFADPSLEFLTQVNHGCKVIGSPFELTRCEGNQIYEFNGMPVWKFWTEKLGLPETAHWTEVTPLAPLAFKLPEKLWDEYGNNNLVYACFGVEQDGSMFLPVFIKEGTKLWFSKRDEKTMFKGVEFMAKQIKDKLANRKPLAVLQADCGSRGRMSFNRILKEDIVNRMQYPICGEDQVPWLGFYASGEFGMLGGQNMYHHFTASLCVITRNED